MSNSTPATSWQHHVAEGLVIIISILLAFSIDAWWGQQQERHNAEDQVARVSAELRAGVTILEFQDQSLDESTQAAMEFLSIMGPDVEPASTQQIGTFVARIFGVKTLSLNTSAVQDFISSGQLTEGSWVGIRLALAKMLSDVKSTENSSTELRQMRPAIIRGMDKFVSGLDIVKSNPVMANYPVSKFNSDANALLSDMEYESLIANYSIRMELNRNAVNSLLEDYRAIIGKIEDMQ